MTRMNGIDGMHGVAAWAGLEIARSGWISRGMRHADRIL